MMCEDTAISNSGDRLMLCELSHRINNEFASAIGLLVSAAFRAADPDVRCALNDIQSRLHAFARVHHMLTVPDFQTRMDAHAYLRELCDAIWRSKLEHSGIAIHLRSDPIMMSSEQCWKLALIVTELVTNSARHAYRNTGGLIRVDVSKRGGDIQCVVSDDGNSRSNTPAGRGLRIVSAITRELGGIFSQEYPGRGTVSTLVFASTGEQALHSDLGPT
jgi:two-component sensor histidine kinase